MIQTLLDDAVTAMAEQPESDTVRLAVFELLATSELFLLLDAEPVGEAVEPRLFETSDGSFVLAFDREERLTDFAEGPAPYAALPGRAIAAMLSDQSIGLGLNLGVAPSSYLFPTDAMAWLAEQLSNRPNEAKATPQEFRPPNRLPDTLLTSLDARLAQAEGLAAMAYLASVTYSDNRKGHLLAVIDCVDGAENALTHAIQEALTFSNLDAGELDVTFLKSSDPAAARLAKVGLRFDLPKREQTERVAPGLDPSKPPRLK